MLHLLISLFYNLLEFDINPTAQNFVCNYNIFLPVVSCILFDLFCLVIAV